MVSEDIDDRGEVCGKDTGVKVKEVLKAVHVGPLHKVLPILQLGQQTLLLSQPGTRSSEEEGIGFERNTCRPRGIFSLPSVDGVDLPRCSPDQLGIGMRQLSR